MSDEKRVYVDIGKKLEFRRFNPLGGKKPGGWYRLDYLKNKLRTDIAFRLKFYPEEIHKILNYKEKCEDGKLREGDKKNENI